MKIRMTLSIGYPQAKHHDEIEINDEEIPEELRGGSGKAHDALMDWLHQEYWQEWANGYIDGGVEIIEGPKP